jgi:hypothetical protein
MLEFLGDKASARKLRLFATACCRRLWAQLARENSRRAVLVAEQFADGLISKRDLALAGNAARSNSRPRDHAVEAARCCAYADAWIAALFTSDQVVSGWPTSASELAAWVRDVFGSPFHTTTYYGGSMKSTALQLAQAAYEERILPAGHLEPQRLAVLADALEEGGCTDQAILDHLRSPGAHVRGCWALDLVLNRE